MTKRTASNRSRKQRARVLAVNRTIAKIERVARPGISMPTQRNRLRRRPVLRVPRSLGLSAPSMARAVSHSAGILTNQITSSPDLPCANARPFREVRAKWTIQPVMNGNATSAVAVFNPHLMWTDYYTVVSSFDATGNLSTAYKQVPSLYCPTNNGTMEPVFPSTDAGTGATYGTPAYTGVADSIITNTQTLDGLSGDVRFLGGTATFRSFETNLNTGGRLYYVHNPKNRSLLRLTPQTGTGASGTGYTKLEISGANIGDVIAARSTTSMTVVTGEPVQVSILPHTTEFEPIDTSSNAYFSGSYTASQEAFAVSQVMDQLNTLLAESIGDVRHYGWTQAFVYIPAATKSAGASANCEIEFDLHFHVNVQNAGSATANWGQSAAVQNLSAGISDARAASTIQTVMDGVKDARQQNPAAAFQRPSETPGRSLGSQIPNILGRLAKAVPDAARALANMLPPGLPRTIAEGVGTVGEILVG